MSDDAAAPEVSELAAVPAEALGSPAAGPAVVDGIAVARLYGEPLFQMPQDLYIPPDALEVFLETFVGPLDLLTQEGKEAFLLLSGGEKRETIELLKAMMKLSGR